MKIKTIRVSAGRTIPHPTESYANLKFFVEFTAELAAKEDSQVATVRLQSMADASLNAEISLRREAINIAASIEREKREKEYARQRVIQDAELAVRNAEIRLANIQAGREPDDDGIPF